MKNQLEQLIRLQKIESQLISLRREIKAIPDRLNAARETLEILKNQHQAVKTDGDSSNKKRRSLERDLETCEGKIQKAREHQSAIKSNKEYQVHLHEIEVLKIDKGKIEEDLLILMDEVESLDAREKEELEKVTNAEAEFERLQKNLEEKENAVKIELEQIDEQRKSISSDVEGPVLKKFQKLVSQGRDRAVVPIENGTCGGCYLNLPPQLVAEVKTGDAILACSQCQRILYWAEKSPDSAKLTATGPE